MRLIPILTAASVALLVVACQPAETTTQPPANEPTVDSAPPTADANALTSTGWGALRIGMTRAEVEAAMGPTATPEAVGAAEPEICDQFRPQRAPGGLLVMLGNGVLSRVSVFEPSALVTVDGFGVGSSAAEIKAFYGERAVVTPHAYNDAPSEDIYVWDGDRPGQDEYLTDASRRGIRYEIGMDGRVMQVHVGGPDIQLVEGCS